ncbi:YdbC family protein [Bacillus sp. FSL H8-0515]|uniref:YdbC family protein n=1 Tax=Bacillus sp. FSL H8-0515 TaxID=2921396 RepID=UPI00227DAC1C|nr:YdbC family protein [Bacillus sp. S20C3]MCY8205414.1 YdbC family protein [Bacillus sp. N12A5]MCY8289322.1 YdbC family protein [Bacillus sp. N13C7]MCY8637809.1 YdbC family protein [Bacillus sp. S17B2]MCY8719581.1 YdbC family protein [Bacillus sp. S10C12M]MCY9145298.1 YdbC family protein [Bacillus sp. T9C1]
MLIKKIVCEVDDANAEAFSKAQSQWGALSYISGFIKQAGGWRKTANGPLTAEIIGVWENRAAYDHFMENEHDSIYEENEQKAVILSIEVALYEEDEPFVHDLLHHPDIRYEPGWTVLKA